MLEDEIIKLKESIIEMTKIIERFIEKNNIDVPRMIPLSRWEEFHSYPSMGAMRNIIFHEKTNGADQWIRRIGRKIFVNEQEFFKWVNGQK